MASASEDGDRPQWLTSDGQAWARLVDEVLGPAQARVTRQVLPFMGLTSPTVHGAKPFIQRLLCYADQRSGRLDGTWLHLTAEAQHTGGSHRLDCVCAGRRRRRGRIWATAAAQAAAPAAAPAAVVTAPAELAA